MRNILKKAALWIAISALCIGVAHASTTTNYSFTKPTVGGSPNTWGTSLNANFDSIDSYLRSISGGMLQGVNSSLSNSSDLTLTNPLVTNNLIGFTATGKSLIMPAMNAATSPAVGGVIHVVNAGSNTFDILSQDGTTSIAVSLLAGKDAFLTLTDNSTANGTWSVKRYGDVTTVSSGAGISIDNTDPLTPIISTDGTQVIGPSSATDSYVALFDGTTGKLIKNGYAIGTSANNIVKLDSSAKLPAVDGSALTNLNTVSPQTKQYLKSGTSATYTTPSGCKKILVQMIGGGGGGGAASVNGTDPSGGTGGTTSFNSITAIGGSGGGSGGLTTRSGGAGGTGGSGTASLRLSGSSGTGGGGSYFSIGTGGSGYFGGAGRSIYTSAGTNGGTNTGAGGAGGSGADGVYGGGGGGSGEYVEFSISSPSSTYTYTIGSGGSGATGYSYSGGNGGSGLIVVTEYY